jgi:magnesium-transporting ATPase (P-type)
MVSKGAVVPAETFKGVAPSNDGEHSKSESDCNADHGRSGRIMADYRSVPINNAATGAQKFINNVVITSKYTWYNFVFKNLFEQFRRFANMYFLLIGLLQQIPSVTPTNRFATLAPLVLVLTCIAIKELWEDVRRHRQDDAQNNAIATVLRAGRLAHPPVCLSTCVVQVCMRQSACVHACVRARARARACV